MSGLKKVNDWLKKKLPKFKFKEKTEKIIDYDPYKTIAEDYSKTLPLECSRKQKDEGKSVYSQS